MASAGRNESSDNTVEYRHADPLVTRLMCIKMMKEVNEIAEPLHVIVIANNECDSLTIFGTTEAAAYVNNVLESMAESIQNSLTNSTVTADGVQMKVFHLISDELELFCMVV